MVIVWVGKVQLPASSQTREVKNADARPLCQDQSQPHKDPRTPGFHYCYLRNWQSAKHRAGGSSHFVGGKEGYLGDFVRLGSDI